MPAFDLLGGEEHGGILLDSALGEPQQTFGGKSLYRTVFDKAAALFRSLIKDHPFRDGNKRMALASTEIFLLLNGYVLCASQDERVDFALKVAASEPDMSWQEIAKWIRQNSLTHEDFNRRLDEAVERFRAGETTDTDFLGKSVSALDLEKAWDNFEETN